MKTPHEKYFDAVDRNIRKIHHKLRLNFFKFGSLTDLFEFINPDKLKVRLGIRAEDPSWHRELAEVQAAALAAFILKGLNLSLNRPLSTSLLEEEDFDYLTEADYVERLADTRDWLTWPEFAGLETTWRLRYLNLYRNGVYVLIGYDLRNKLEVFTPHKVT